MGRLKLNLLMVGTTFVLFIAALALNELLFTRLEVTAGINWIYLPAGIRLLATLLFAEAGAVGLLLVSWVVCFFIFFPDDLVRSFMGGILASVSPWLVYRGMQHFSGLRPSLANLTPGGLLACACAFSVASPLLHHLWFWLYEHKTHLADSFLAMVTGDFFGTLIVLYLAKGLLALYDRKRASLQ